MPDNSIHIEIDSSELDKFVNDLTSIPNDPKVRSNIGKALSHALQESTDWAFENERDPNTGKYWVARVIDRSYVKHLTSWLHEETDNRPTKPHKKLQLHPNQGGSLTGNIQTKSGDGYATISAGIGSNIRYARIHQLGGLTGRGHKAKIPARPYLGLTKEERMYALEDIADILINAIRKNAGKK